MAGEAARTLVVWCPDWPVVASGRTGDGTAPVAVLASGRVLACSPTARDEGVERGIRRRQAEARCPGLVVVDHDPGRDARAFEAVVAAVESLTPRVEVVRPGMCTFPTRGPSRYYGGDHRLAALVAATVDNALQPLSAKCRVGIAAGLFAAERAARRGQVVARGETAAFLAPFPVSTLIDSALPEAGEIAGLLRRLGISTLGQLAALPADAVLARFGPAGTTAHLLAGGLDDRPRSSRIPPPELAAVTEIDPPADQFETVVFVARSLAARLQHNLAERGLALDTVRVEAETEHGESLVRVWRHDGGLSDAALAERVRWQLENWISSGGGPTGGITRLALVPEGVGPDGASQFGFWGGDRAVAERAARALARVQGVLGPEGVVTAVIGGGRGPAQRVELVAWGDRRPRPDPSPPWPGRVPPPSPATVHVQPLGAEVVDASGAPVAVDGRGMVSAEPARLSVAGGPWSDVVAWAGPWPVDERWWDLPARRRRARCQVVTQPGDAYLLAVEKAHWLVEATYD